MSFGEIAVFDAEGQVGELQIGWPVLWAEHAKRCGFDPVGVEFDLPAGKRIKIISVPDADKPDEGRFSWRVIS